MPIERIRDDLRKLFSAAQDELSAATEADPTEPDQAEPDDCDDQGAALAAIRRELVALNRRRREIILAALARDFTELKGQLNGRCAAVLMTDAVVERIMQVLATIMRDLMHWHAVPAWAPAYTPERHQRNALDLQGIALLEATIAGDLKAIEAREASFPRTPPTPATVTESDETEYVPAAYVLHDSRLKNFAELRKILAANQWIRTRRPYTNRLEIHAGDWLRYREGVRRECELAQDTAATVVKEADQMKDAIRLENGIVAVWQLLPTGARAELWPLLPAEVQSRIGSPARRA